MTGKHLGPQAWRVLTYLVWGAGSAGVAVAVLLPMTINDFRLSGSQIGDVSPQVMISRHTCAECHGNFDARNDPHTTWEGSLMGNAGRDPLFYAQLATANQDAANVGYFCLRCHVPMSFVTGHAYTADGSTLDNTDREGVNCHFCHMMVDPIYKPGISPPQDVAVLNALDAIPQYYGNAMFVLDPTGLRRGPYTDATPPHPAVASPFQRTGDFCGTCHDVGNVAVALQPDGTYRYNLLDAPTPTEDPHQQFPLERTYTEWKLSAFANGGVDMGGRFGGDGAGMVSTCQDCHMPRTAAQGCFFGPQRSDLARHEFAGASAWVLQIIGEHYGNDPEVNTDALQVGRERAVAMLERAASLVLGQDCGRLQVRVINESGHKLPTGHIEGRRVWINVRFVGAEGETVREYGAYDAATAELAEDSTTVYEMHVGLSEEASAITGYPAGVTTHMSLADTIEKDNRIPPRGFTNTAFMQGGAPVVGASYADGQYWDDASFAIPDGVVRAEATLYYQTVTRHYVEALRDANVTDDWGDILYDLWLATDKNTPILMTSATLQVDPFLRGDFDGDEDVDLADLSALGECMDGPGKGLAPGCDCFDIDGGNGVDLRDFAVFQVSYTGP